MNFKQLPKKALSLIEQFANCEIVFYKSKKRQSTIRTVKFKRVPKLKCKESITTKPVKPVKHNYRLDIFTTDDHLANLFKQMYGEKIIYVYDDKSGKSGEFYKYDGRFWKVDRNKRELSMLVASEFYDNTVKILRGEMSKSGGNNEMISKIVKEMKKLLSTTANENVIKRLKHHLYKDITFDTNPFIFVFDNGVYDLKKFEFRNSRADEFISNSMTCGYDYIENNDDDFKFITEYFNKTLTNDLEDSEVFKVFLSTSLLGMNVKKFCINNGAGNNNKSKLMEAVAFALGDYAMRLDISNLCGKKDRATLNNLDKKRFVFTEEPNRDVVLDGNFLKELTGCDVADWRKIYSSQCKVMLQLTLFISCNKKPPISSVDEATRNRLIDFPFLSVFTTERIDNERRFMIDPYFQSQEFRERYKMSIFHYLVSYLKVFFENKEQIKMTKNLEKRRDEYLLDSDDFYCWFMDEYVIENDSQEFIKMKSIFSNFVKSEYYNNLTKKMKRKMNKSRFLEELLSRGSIKKLFIGRYQPKVNGKQQCHRSVFLGLKEKEKRDCDIDNESDDEE